MKVQAFISSLHASTDYEPEVNLVIQNLGYSSS